MDQTTTNNSGSLILYRSSNEFKERDAKATVCHLLGVRCSNAQPKYFGDASGFPDLG